MDPRAELIRIDNKLKELSKVKGAPIKQPMAANILRIVFLCESEGVFLSLSQRHGLMSLDIRCFI